MKKPLNRGFFISAKCLDFYSEGHYFNAKIHWQSGSSMARKTLIFGNGLGMALDHKHFSLARAMEAIWAHPTYLPAIQKALVSQCVGNGGAAPEGEDQLDTLHSIVTACASISRLEDAHTKWLTADGRSFPDAVARYIFKVATNLHIYHGDLPNTFLQPLFAFLRATNSNIATLNYDRLLYGALVDESILAGYNGHLVDGMWDDGFNEDNLVRKYGNNFGYYMHLHGSPLFYDTKMGTTKKRTRDVLSMSTESSSNHIVLTHVKHKTSVIDASPVLSTYWSYLHSSCQESEEIIVFGYSGMDVHLNRVIAAYAQSLPVRVIEWEGAGALAARELFWKRSFMTQKVKVIQLENILDFIGW